jgi:excisionase family DNA binding protein
VSENILSRADQDERTRTRLTYTIKEACVIIGISRTTLWKAIRTGRLGCYRIGRRVMFSEEHMTGYLKLHEKSGRSHSFQ